MPDSSSLQREVEAETTRLFPGAVRRVGWLRYGDSPLIEPGEIMPTFVLAEPRRSRGPRSGPRDTLTAFQHEHGPALKQFRLELVAGWFGLRREVNLGLEFPAVPGAQDDLGYQVGAQAELLRDLVRPPSLLVVEQREFLLGLGPRPRDLARRRAGPGRPG